jgi:hypothetical protein
MPGIAGPCDNGGADIGSDQGADSIENTEKTDYDCQLM